MASRQSPQAWLKQGTSMGVVILNIFRNEKYDGENEKEIDWENLKSQVNFIKFENGKYSDSIKEEEISNGVLLTFHLGDGREMYKHWGNHGWFSAGFGPFRRFSGGNQETEKLYKSYPRLGAHLSIFGEDVALSEALEWVKELDYLRLKENEKKNGQESTITYNSLIKFINQSNLLPHNVQIEGIDKEGIVFKDGNGNSIQALELSDGYRSILSLTFELIRQLVRVYGAQEVFMDIEKGKMQISLPGVVLIDEIDAHLHPSWQTRIGQWFTQYFPNIQFIVTTHSPLVCRACEKGSIWRLAAPGSDIPSGEITGVEREKLIYGNILDAYGTEVFGTNTVRSAHSQEKLEQLGKLNMLFALGKIKPTEEKERLELQKILGTDDPTGF